MTGHIIRLICLIPAGMMAWVLFRYEERVWRGWAQVASIVKGRYDTTMPTGNNLGGVRVFVLRTLIIVCAVSLYDILP